MGRGSWGAGPDGEPRRSDRNGLEVQTRLEKLQGGFSESCDELFGRLAGFTILQQHGLSCLTKDSVFFQDERVDQIGGQVLAMQGCG